LDTASATIGKRPVANVDTSDVMKVLEPIWTEKPETASRLRGRIEAVLDYAAARGWRKGENPARWRGHLAKLPPAPGKIARVQHHPALPYAEVAAFMAVLRADGSIAALALECTVLTAARTGEVIGATWGEIDIQAVWTVPAERMKAGRKHRVPLTEAALDVLRKAARLRRSEDAEDYVFPGMKDGKPMSNMAMNMLLRRMERTDPTVHGFRSTFRDWAAAATAHPREVAEQTLAHSLSDKVEAAYRRGDLFEKRRRLMDDWAAYCARPSEVAPIRGNAA
jgi:integrase